MPVNVKVIHPKEFIKTTATGALDFAASKQALLDIASLITQPGEYQVLLDLRGASLSLSLIEVYQLAEALTQHRSLLLSKISLLPSISEVGDARFFETITHNRGAHVRAFYSFEQAMNWLIDDQPDG